MQAVEEPKYSYTPVHRSMFSSLLPASHSMESKTHAALEAAGMKWYAKGKWGRSAEGKDKRIGHAEYGNSSRKASAQYAMQLARETKGSQTIFHKYIRNKTKGNVDPLIRREGKQIADASEGLSF